ncbi:ribonuclease H-like domain-containing protein [Tanacetum coccineum]
MTGNPQQKEYKEKGVIDSGFSWHMTGNKCYLTKYEDYDGGFVSFRDGKGRISRKGKIKTGTLDFDNVYFCKELKYNLFSVSQICEKNNNVFFTDTECLVLSSNFKLLDESQVLLRVPRKDNIYSVDLKSVVPTKDLTCLFAKAIIDESNICHRRLGHINFKNMNKLIRGNLVRGLPSKIFENNPSCAACQKGKQHEAFFDLKIENQLDFKVKVIRSNNGTEFKSSVMNQFCEMKEINREFSIARTPQQNGVAERKNRTLIEAARTIKPVSAAGLYCTDDDLSSPVNAAEASNAFEEHLFEQFSPFKNAFTLQPVLNCDTTKDNIEGIGKGRVIIQQDFDNLETELQEARAQIDKLQRKHMGNNSKIALARFRIANLEQNH